MITRRLQKLQATMSSYSPEAEIHWIRLEAFDRIDHDDRRAISRVARMYGTGMEVESTEQLNAVMTRWGAMVAEIAAARVSA
jgi:hypothetical protein